jgi:hypothetical protein
MCAAMLTLAGCSSGSSSAPSAPPPTGSASYNDLAAAFVQYAQCARTHGLPDLPDPVIDQQGNDSYPPLTGSPRWPESVLTGCASVWDHVHAIRDLYDASHGLQNRSTFSLSPTQALAFARCIRLHGFPSYPDPGADGVAGTVPPGFQKPNLSAAAIAAISACTAQVSHG